MLGLVIENFVDSSKADEQIIQNMFGPAIESIHCYSGLIFFKITPINEEDILACMLLSPTIKHY